MFTDVVLIKAAVQKALSAIGKKNGTAPPESTSNSFGIAYEFFIADIMRGYSNKRYDEAKKAAIESGIFGDVASYADGTTTVAYESEHFDVIAKRANGSARLDRTMLSNELTKRYGADEARKIIAASEKPSAGALTLSVAL